MKKIIIILISLILSISVFSQKNGNIDKIKITVKFTSTPSTYSVTKTPLKYNKLFAFSCQLDDGGLDTYTYGFPFLNGGTINGTVYTGLNYTDGCGNDIKFKMSSSIFSMDSDEIIDVHDPKTGWNFLVTWSQLISLYKNDWGISNHGFTNKTGDYEYSVERNHSYVKLQTTQATPEGINMGIFVNPNGDTLFSKYAYQQGYPICFSQSYYFGSPSFDVTSNWNRNNIRMGRSNFYTGISIASLANNIASASINGAHHWGVAFSHSITNGGYGYVFDTFKSEMTNIENNFGKSGSDNIWMTTEEEVLDYLLLSPYLNINTQKSGNDLIISFTGNLPVNLRFYAISLIVNSDANIQSIQMEGPAVMTYNGNGTNTSLINLTFDKSALLPDTIDPAIKDANFWVTKTENTKSQKDANVSMDYVNILPSGTIKDGFRHRLCSIVGLTFPQYFCSLSVNENIENGIEVYPNPTSKNIIIKNTSMINKISILDIFGKNVYSNIVNTKDIIIDIESFKRGIYFIKIECNKNITFYKVLIK